MTSSAGIGMLQVHGTLRFVALAPVFAFFFFFFLEAVLSSRCEWNVDCSTVRCGGLAAWRDGLGEIAGFCSV